jgi:hypothetical protein
VCTLANSSLTVVSKSIACSLAALQTCVTCFKVTKSDTREHRVVQPCLKVQTTHVHEIV